MRKPVIQILAFLITLSIGIVAYYFLYLSPSSSVKEVVPITDVTSSELKSIEIDSESVEPWVIKLPPCQSKNSLSYPSRRDKRSIAGGVLNSRVTCGTLPEYPSEAKEKNISGVVTVSVLIDEIGEVIKVRAKSGDPLLLKSAVKAAQQTRFSPTLLGGMSYKVEGILMYKFDSEKGTWLQEPTAPDNPFKTNQ